MESIENVPELRQFVAVIRSGSSVHFRADEPLIVRDWPTQYGTVDLVFRTRYLDRGLEHTVPGDLWRFGHELLALAHLYMGMEALAEAAVREHCRRRALEEHELAAELGVAPWTSPSTSCNRCAKRAKSQWRYEFLSAVRRRLLFHGDIDCYKKAREASDGFEHGFAPFDQMRGLARDARDRTANYLRQAILDLANLDEVSRTKLLAVPFDVPLGPWPVTHYVFGRLIGPVDHLAAVGQEYPFLRRESSVKAVSRSNSGNTSISFGADITVVIGEGIRFRPERQEVWGPGPKPPEAPAC